MRTKSFTSVGSFHPILFIAVVYVVALFFSIFICSALFYSCNTSSTRVVEEKSIQIDGKAPVLDHLAFK